MLDVRGRIACIEKGGWARSPVIESDREAAGRFSAANGRIRPTLIESRMIWASLPPAIAGESAKVLA